MTKPTRIRDRSKDRSKSERLFERAVSMGPLVKTGKSYWSPHLKRYFNSGTAEQAARILGYMVSKELFPGGEVELIRKPADLVSPHRAWELAKEGEDNPRTRYQSSTVVVRIPRGLANAVYRHGDVAAITRTLLKEFLNQKSLENADLDEREPGAA